MKIVKEVVRVGNTGGVLVPREWVRGRAEVRLVEEPLEVEGDVLHLLKPWLNEVKGVYLVGSYARGEQTARSDVDILVITGKTTKRIQQARYQLILISQNELEQQLQTNAMPLLPMVKEAKPVLNKELIEPYRHAQITRRNIQWHLETTASALEVIKAAIDIDKEENVSDNLIYSLILRLRGVYIVECLIKGKIAKTKELLALIKKLSGSTQVYEVYLRSKDRRRARRVISVEEVEAIVRYIIEKLNEQRKWVEKRG